MGGRTPRRDGGAPRHGAAHARGLPAGCRAMVLLGENLQTWRRTAGLFIFTLIPIAIAYHLAHYLSSW